MNIFKLFFCFLILCNFIFADEHKIGALLKIETDKGQKSGFLKYEGKHFNKNLVILSQDIGSAVPTADLRLYKANDNQKYTEIFNIPFQEYRGFLCKVIVEKLEIFIVDNYKAENPKLFMSIDLKLLLIEQTKDIKK